MNLAQHWLLLGILVLLGAWLIWVWFGYEADLSKNPRNAYFAASAAHNDFLALQKPQLEARGVALLKRLEPSVFVELIKQGLQPLEAGLNVDLTAEQSEGLTIFLIKRKNGERLLVGCTQWSIRKNRTFVEEFAKRCLAKQLTGIFIHLGVTNQFQANYLRQTYSVHLLSGHRFLLVLTGQFRRLQEVYPLLDSPKKFPLQFAP